MTNFDMHNCKNSEIHLQRKCRMPWLIMINQTFWILSVSLTTTPDPGSTAFIAKGVTVEVQ